MSAGRRLLNITKDMERALQREDYGDFCKLLEERREIIEGIQSFDTETERQLIEDLMVIDRRMRTLLASRMEDIKRDLKVLHRKKKVLRTYLSKG